MALISRDIIKQTLFRHQVNIDLYICLERW